MIGYGPLSVVVVSWRVIERLSRLEWCSPRRRRNVGQVDWMTAGQSEAWGRKRIGEA